LQRGFACRPLYNIKYNYNFYYILDDYGVPCDCHLMLTITAGCGQNGVRGARSRISGQEQREVRNSSDISVDLSAPKAK
jgi:hypothetical protein